jgi:hypothetical protein
MLGLPEVTVKWLSECAVGDLVRVSGGVFAIVGAARSDGLPMRRQLILNPTNHVHPIVVWANSEHEAVVCYGASYLIELRETCVEFPARQSMSDLGSIIVSREDCLIGAVIGQQSDGSLGYFDPKSGTVSAGAGQPHMMARYPDWELRLSRGTDAADGPVICSFPRK